MKTTVVLVLLSLACEGGAPMTPSSSDAGASDSGVAAGDGGAPTDGGTRREDGAAPPVDGGGSGACDGDDSVSGRGYAWVRSNPMFISGLTVSMGPPPRAFVDAYFDDFGANAVHLWEDGVPFEVDGWRAARGGAPFVAWVNSSGVSHANRRVIGGYEPVPGRIGYQVGDEPLSMAAYLEIEEGLRAVRTADPGALTIVNFSYRATGFEAILDRYCESGLGDVVSYDRYSRSRSEYETLEKIRDIGLRCDMPYWRYIESYAHSAPTQTESDMRWAALVGLVYGYTGHTWFLYQVASGHMLGVTLFDRVSDFAARRTERFDWAAQINREMAVYGRAITQLTSTDVRYVPALLGIVPDETTAWSPGAGGDSILTGIEAVDGEPLQEGLVGHFADRCGDRYVMVQNPNHADGSFPFESTRHATFRLTFDFAGAPASLARDHVVSLDGRASRLIDLPLAGDGDRRTIDLRVAPGDVAFFKYATGNPFVGFE